MKERIYHLDLFRFLAALLVVSYHFGFRSGPADQILKWHSDIIAPWAKYGYLGVHLFFLISGFVILMSVQGQKLADFARSRFWRLFPTYWLAGLLTLLFMNVLKPSWFDIQPKEVFYNLFMVHSLLGIRSIDSVYWTLVVEMRFYCMVALVLILGQIKRFENLNFVWLCTCAALSIWPLHHLRFLFIAEYAPLFIAGANFYFIRSQGVSFKRMFVMLGSLMLILQQNWQAHPPLFDVLYSTGHENLAVSALLCGFWLLFTLFALKKLEILNQKVFLMAGVLTYPLYLIHQNIGIALINTLMPKWGVISSLLFTFSIIFAMAYCVNRYFELPIQKWRKSRILEQ